MIPIPNDLMTELSVRNDQKVVLLVLDGLGGLPGPDGQTELEAASTPNLDALAARSELGLSYPLSPGLTPGSGPAHLALFGYDALRHNIGRGALSALGVGLRLDRGDVAARINFCTVDSSGVVTDRRAGRIATEVNERLCRKLRDIRIPDVEFELAPESQYRAVVVIRGAGLSDQLTDSDPQHTGVAPLPVEPAAPTATSTAMIVNSFLDQARAILHDDHPANMILLRGFATHPDLPSLESLRKLRCGAIAVYPMYRGLAKIVGMTVLGEPHDLDEEMALLERNWASFDFFFVHVKPTDSAGEDGNFGEKRRVVEKVDEALPRLLALNPDVIVITGDHSTPTQLKAHSWHPLPLLLYSRWVRPDGTAGFSERTAAHGSLGTIVHQNVLDLAMAHALKLDKFGA